MNLEASQGQLLLPVSFKSLVRTKTEPVIEMIEPLDNHDDVADEEGMIVDY